MSSGFSHSQEQASQLASRKAGWQELHEYDARVRCPPAQCVNQGGNMSVQAEKNVSVRVRKRQYLRKRHLSPRKRRVCGRSPSQKTLRVWEVPPRKRCVRGTGRSRPENVCVHGRSCTGARAHTRKRCVRGRSCPENVACVGGPARARARARWRRDHGRDRGTGRPKGV